MEYSEDFRLVQTTLNHCNEFVKKFDQILYYGGNEVYVDEIATRLKDMFLSRSYHQENCDNLRKITFFLMLNTNASFSRDLSEDFSICHLLHNFPQLSKCLLINLVFKLNLEKYFYECLKYSPSWFMMQFLPEVIDSLRFSKPLEVVVQVKEVVESIYCNICRMDYKIMSSNQQIDQKRILSQLVELTMTLLSNYNSPNVDVGKSKKKMQEYIGFSLNNQLKLLITCLNMFLNKPEFVVKEEHQIYKLMVEKEPEVNNYSNKSYSTAVKDSLSQINVFLLNTLQNSVITVTITDFMYWVEVDIEDHEIEDEDLKRDNLQKSVGELSYALIELISNNECFEHNVVNQLQTISIKPKSIAEIASNATVGTLLEKIESSPSKRIWFEELLNRPDTLYFNTECLQAVIDNASIIKSNDLFRILKDHKNYEGMDNEDEQQIKQIFRAGTTQLNNLEIRNFTEELIRVFDGDYNLEENVENFSSRLTNYFNKLTEKRLNEDEMWKLVVINPSRFFENLLDDVGNQDRNQIEIVLKILSETSSIAEDYIKSNIWRNLEASSESAKTLNHIFLAGIFKLNLIERKEFIRELLVITANAMTNDKQLFLAMLLNTLLEISGKLKMEDSLSPLLVLVAQILEKYRWDMMSFTSLKERIVERSIEIIQILIKTLLTNAQKKDKDWILSKIKDCKVMTKFYFQKLSLEKNESVVDFDKFLHPNGFDGASKSKITSFLCETIVRTSSKEFKWLMKNERFHPFITDALLVVTVIAGRTNQPGVSNNLHKCVSDYVKVLNDLIIPSMNNNEQKQLILNNILKMFNKFPTASYDELTILFIESMQTFKDCDNFIASISELQDCEMKRILLEGFAIQNCQENE